MGVDAEGNYIANNTPVAIHIVFKFLEAECLNISAFNF